MGVGSSEQGERASLGAAAPAGSSVTVNTSTPGLAIVTFTSPGMDPVEQGRELGRKGFVTTYRATGIRVSPHGYNTADEIDAFLAEVSV